jgi:hypothetical protein
MADTLTSKIALSFAGTLRNDIGTSVARVDIPDEFTRAISLTDGTTANKADKLWFSTGRTLAQAGAEDIDVYDFASLDIGAGAGVAPLSGALTLAEIVALVILNRTTSAGSLLIGGKGTTAAWNSWINSIDDAEVGPIGPGGFFAIGDPNATSFAVADTANHLLTITESNVGAVTYDIAILGRSA